MITRSMLHTRSTATTDGASVGARGAGTVPGYARPRSSTAVLLILIDAHHSMVEPINHTQAVGLTHEVVRIPGADHFYPRTVHVVSTGQTRMSLESVMSNFLHRHLRLREMR